MMKATPILAAIVLTLGAADSIADAVPYHGEGHVLLQPSDLNWSSIGSMAPGARIAIIEGDLSKDAPFTLRLKLPADYRIEPHVHPAYERVTVLSGTFHFAHGEVFDESATKALQTGGVGIMPPGAPMFGYTEEETIIQLHGTGPWGIEYIDPAHDPRS